MFGSSSRRASADAGLVALGAIDIIAVLAVTITMLAIASASANSKAAIHHDAEGNLHIRTADGSNQTVFINGVDVPQQMDALSKLRLEVQQLRSAMESANGTNAILEQRVALLEAIANASDGGGGLGPGSGHGQTTEPPQTTRPGGPGSSLTTPVIKNGGNRTWTTVFGSGSGSGGDVAVDSSHFVYVTGYTTGSLDGRSGAGLYDVALIKFDSTGRKLWSTLIGSKESEYSSAIATDSANSVYIACYTSGSFDGVSNAGKEDLLLIKTNNNGVKKWSRQLGSSASDRATALAIDLEDNAVVGGYTAGG